jgi:hypothetical protein
MRHARTTLIALVVVFASTGCNQRDLVADGAGITAGLPSIDNVAGAMDGTSSADGSAPTNATAATAAAPLAPTTAIPAALHGRWGLTPADCTSTKGDTKGLLVISSDRLTFYESRALPARNIRTTSDSFSADFAFTGEGQKWNRFETLRITKGKLVRTESSPMASFTYVRCN